jgi:hypothetical protein
MQSGGVDNVAGCTSHTTDAPSASARQYLPASAAAIGCSGVAQRQPAVLYCSSCPAAHVGGIIAAICACRLAKLSGGDGGLGGGDGLGGGGSLGDGRGRGGGRGGVGGELYQPGGAGSSGGRGGGGGGDGGGGEGGRGRGSDGGGDGGGGL